MIKEILEKMNDDVYKIAMDKDIGRKTAPWVYSALIMDVLDSTIFTPNMKKSVNKAMKNLGLTDQDDLYAIWSSIDKNITDKMLTFMQIKKGIN